ncbi:hypothetical protein SPETJ133_09530 [Staphylococcus petrasii]
MVFIFSLLLIISFVSAIYHLYLYAFTSPGHVTKNLYWFIGSLVVFILMGVWLIELL